jgi:hypothetical protein
MATDPLRTGGTQSRLREGDIRLPGRGDLKSGGLRWSPELEGMKQLIATIPDATVKNLAKNILPKFAKEIVTSARDKAPWRDHPERHRGATAFFVGQDKRRRGPGADRRWPHNLTAREGLFSYVRWRKSFVEVGLSHDPQTVYVTSRGERFNYGKVLETGFGGRYAIVAKTLLRFRGDMIRKCEGAMAAGQVSSPPEIQRVHPGWSKGR